MTRKITNGNVYHDMWGESYDFSAHQQKENIHFLILSYQNRIYLVFMF